MGILIDIMRDTVASNAVCTTGYGQTHSSIAVQYGRYQKQNRLGTGLEPSAQGLCLRAEGGRQGTGPKPYRLQASGRALGLKAVWQHQIGLRALDIVQSSSW